MELNLDSASDRALKAIEEHYNGSLAKLGFPPRYQFRELGHPGQFYILPFTEGEMAFYVEDKAVVESLPSVQVKYSYFFQGKPGASIASRFKAAMAERASSCLLQADSFCSTTGAFARCLGGAETHYDQVKLYNSPKDLIPPDGTACPSDVHLRNFVVNQDESEYLHFYNANLGWLGIPPGMEFMSQVVTGPSFDPAGYFIAERDGRFVGFGAIEVDPWGTGHKCFAYIYQIGVLPELKGTGLARYLLNRMFSHAKDRGISLVAIGVRRSNLPAMKLCQKFGMKEAYSTMGFEVHL